MIKQFLQRWLGIQELSDSETITRTRVNRLYSDAYQGKPVYPVDDPHEPVITEKPDVIKGYE